MAQGSQNNRVLGRILDEMHAQDVSYIQLAAALRRQYPKLGWSYEYLALRLGEMLPAPPFGGRIPLTGSEIEQIAAALRVPVEDLTYTAVAGSGATAGSFTFSLYLPFELDELLGAEQVLALATAS